MEKDQRKTELIKVFDDIDPGTRVVIMPLLDEVCYLEGRMNELKKLPFIRVHPEKPDLQRPTAAAKQYKECTQSYMNAIRILCGILNRNETSAQDELLKRLEEFE